MADDATAVVIGALNLVRPPTSLLRPGIVLRVLRGSLRVKRPAGDREPLGAHLSSPW